MSEIIEGIKAEAELLEGEPEAGAVQAEALPVVDPVTVLGEELAGMVSAIVAALSPAIPCLPGIYTDQTTRAASSAIAAVCVKRGWLAGGLFGEYREEIGAAIIVVPLAVATYQGVTEDIERLNRKPEPKADDAKAGAN